MIWNSYADDAYLENFVTYSHDPALWTTFSGTICSDRILPRSYRSPEFALWTLCSEAKQVTSRPPSPTHKKKRKERNVRKSAKSSCQKQIVTSSENLFLSWSLWEKLWRHRFFRFPRVSEIVLSVSEWTSCKVSLLLQKSFIRNAGMNRCIGILRAMNSHKT